MALPTADSNIVGTHILAVTDIGLASSLPNATPVTSVAFNTGAPGTVLVLGQLSSGTATITIRVDDTAAHAVANVASPTATLTLSSTTKLYASVDTSDSAALTTSVNDRNVFDPLYVTPVQNLWVAMQQIGAAGGSIFTQLVILALYELVGGEDWYCIRAGGFLAVRGTSGVGSSGVSKTEPAGFQDGAGNLVLTSF